MSARGQTCSCYAGSLTARLAFCFLLSALGAIELQVGITAKRGTPRHGKRSSAIWQCCASSWREKAWAGTPVTVNVPENVHFSQNEMRNIKNDTSDIRKDRVTKEESRHRAHTGGPRHRQHRSAVGGRHPAAHHDRRNAQRPERRQGERREPACPAGTLAEVGGGGGPEAGGGIRTGSMACDCEMSGGVKWRSAVPTHPPHYPPPCVAVWR